MNERIRKLYEQSWVHGSYQESIEREFVGDEQRYRTVKTSNFDHEYFAKLIIRECLDVMSIASEEAITRFTYMGDDVPTVVHQINIKQHFGVEE